MAKQKPVPGGMKIGFAGKTMYLKPGEGTTPADDLFVYRRTGFSLLDPELPAQMRGLALLWFARVRNGEPNLNFDQMVADLPGYDEFAQMITIDTVAAESPGEG